MEYPFPQDAVVPAPEARLPSAPPVPYDVAGITDAPGGAATGCAGSPVLVTRGEREETGEPGCNLALIDWLAFTVHSGKPDDWRWVRDQLHYVFKIPGYAWQETDRQWHGYQHRADLIQPSDRGERWMLGIVAWGGESQRGTVHVSLNSQACSRIDNWDEVQTWGICSDSAITRVDAAHDDFEGQTVNIDQARIWLQEGGFGGNGRPPRARLYDDLGSGEGKTLYVGNRAYGKLCRVYEKGKHEGDPTSPWNRVEVEWRNKGREIPWNILARPGDYLAGAYPCLAYLSAHQERIKTVRHAAAIQYPRMVENVKLFAGRSLNVMYRVEGGNADAVLQQVLREGAPKRLEPFTAWPGMLEDVGHADSES